MIWFNSRHATVTEVAQIFGCSRSTISRWLYPRRRDKVLPEKLAKCLATLLKKERESSKPAGKKVRVWIPVFFWEDRKGVHYDVHGVEDNLVTNKTKRTDLEGDLVSCFFYNSDDHPEKHDGRLRWIELELENDVVSRVTLHKTKKLMWMP